MHVIKARADPSKLQQSTNSNPYTNKAFATGSGLNQLARAGQQTTISTKPPSQRSVPPSTRAFVKDYAAFHGQESSELNNTAVAKAKAIRSGTDSSSQKPPSTRQFVQAYKAFYDVESGNDDAIMDRARAIKNGTNQTASQTAPSNFRINTGMRQDPNFRANMARFHGSEPSVDDELYKNYRAFYGGATPNVNQASHMGQGHQDQQRTLLRNKLAENAKRILNQKNFDDGFRITKKDDSQIQSQILKESGFDATKQMEKTQADQPASYQTYKATGAAAFTYNRNPKVDKVTKMDPEIKNLNKARYNIITGSIQEWY